MMHCHSNATNALKICENHREIFEIELRALEIFPNQMNRDGVRRCISPHHASEALLPPMSFLYCLRLPMTLAYMVWSPTVQIAGWSNRKGPTIIFAFASAAVAEALRWARAQMFFALHSHPFWCPTLAWQLGARLHGWHAALQGTSSHWASIAPGQEQKEWQRIISSGPSFCKSKNGQGVTGS